MKPKKEYQVVRVEQDEDEFIRKCDECLDDCWELHGSMIVNEGDDWVNYYQAFVRDR